MLDPEQPTEQSTEAERTTDSATGSPPDTRAAGPGDAADAGGGGTAKKAAKKTTARKTAAKKTTTKKAAAKRTTKKTAAAEPGAEPAAGPAAAPATDDPTVAGAAPQDESSSGHAEPPAPAKKTTRKSTAKKTAAKRAAKKATAETPDAATAPPPGETPPPADAPAADAEAAAQTSAAQTPDAGPEPGAAAGGSSASPATSLLFQPPDPALAGSPSQPEESAGGAEPAQDDTDTRQEPEEGGRRRRRGGRRRRRSDDSDDSNDQKQKQDEKEPAETASSKASGDAGKADSSEKERSGSDADRAGDSDSSGGSSSSRRRRRRRRSGDSQDTNGDEQAKTGSRGRGSRSAEDEITALSGSTRLEAKKQRRREGREAGRRRAPIVSEAEFLARREAVDRVMVIRQKKDLTQIAVLEDKVLVEHYVARESQTSLIGNVYLGRVQNVLPSMEAAFIDIGKGRNAVLYAGEVNWDALGAKNGQARKIESVLKSGQSVLVQVTKDPVGHKGARLTSQISLPGRFLVYVPDGTTSGISRKLPDTERNRLKTLLKEIVPESAGVIVRTAAEGASEEELTRDVERLTARWEDISKKSERGNAPQLLYGEPDLTLKVVRDLFTEDFAKLVVSGDDAWDMVDNYVKHVAPDLADRLERYDPDPESGRDAFSEYRIDEQIAKGLDRKVWLPSGGSLIIDRTEAMTVVDVNTGKFTGSGGNLEETVTKNNLEAAEEIVRQLRLRDIGGIIVVDFIDMVLESNRDLVLRRMVECLGRDRTRHQVAEVTSLGLVQMTRKRIGTGLLEAFSEPCEACHGRGIVVHHEPVEPKKRTEEEPRRSRRGGHGRSRSEDAAEPARSTPTPSDVAAMARPENADRPPVDEVPAADEAPSAEQATGEPAAQRDQPAVRPEQPAAQAEEAAVQPEQPAASADRQPEPGPEAASTGGRESGRPRRRATRARRPAGPPSETGADSAGSVAVMVAPEQRTPADASTTDGTATAAGDTGATGGAASDGGQEQAAPKVVTSTVRRRGAVRREAGPPTHE